MPKKLSPFLVLGATVTVALTAPSVQAAQAIPLSQAANQASINLKPNQGVYIQLPSKLPIYRFAIDDGSVLTLGDEFTPGTPIIRVVGKAAGTTGLGLIVQDGSQLQTLNFTVKVGSEGSKGTIQVTDEVYLEAHPPYPVDKVRTGLNFANVRGQIPVGSPLDVAVKKWIGAVQAGQGGTEALEALSLSGDALERLASLGRTTQVTRSKPVPQKQDVTATRRGVKAPPSGLQARVTSLEQQIQALREEKTEPKAKLPNDKEVSPTPPPALSIEGMTPIQIAHAVKTGLHRDRQEYPHRSWKYDQVNTAVILLKRGNSLETASRHSGVDPQTLRILAGEPPKEVSERASK